MVAEVRIARRSGQHYELWAWMVVFEVDEVQQGEWGWMVVVVEVLSLGGRRKEAATNI